MREEEERREKREKEEERKRGKRENGGQIHLSHLVPQNSFEINFCVKICVLIEREKRINKSLTG